MSPAPIFAVLAINVEVIKAVVILLILIISGIASALGKLKQPPPRPLGGGPAQPPAQPDPLDDEIGEFLRRVSPPREPAKRPRSRRAPVQAEVVDQAMAQDVSRHVAEHLDNREYDRQCAQLGAVAAQADDKMNERLHGVFDHSLGQLQEAPSDTSSGAASPTEPPPLAASLLAALSSPENIRQAIILNEVLQRPEGRWR